MTFEKFEFQVRELFIKYGKISEKDNWFLVEISSAHRDKAVTLTILDSGERLAYRAENLEYAFMEILYRLNDYFSGANKAFEFYDKFAKNGSYEE